MEHSQEIRHRWRIIFEQENEAKREHKMLETVAPKQVLTDVDFLQKRIDTLEQQLGDALNPARSKVGAAVVVKDGVLSYRINGQLIPVNMILSALQILQSVYLSQKKLSKDVEKQESDLFKTLCSIFDGGVSENPE